MKDDIHYNLKVYLTDKGNNTIILNEGEFHNYQHSTIKLTKQKKCYIHRISPQIYIVVIHNNIKELIIEGFTPFQIIEDCNICVFNISTSPDVVDEISIKFVEELTDITTK